MSQVGEAARLLGIDLDMREEGQARGMYENRGLKEKLEQQPKQKETNQDLSLNNMSAGFPLVVKQVKQEEFETNSEFQIQVNEVPRFKCQFCNKTSKNWLSLRKHKHKKHPGRASRGDLLCKICSKFINKKFLPRHVEKKHPGVVYDFSDKSGVDGYGNILKELNDDNNRLMCKFCSQMFKTRKTARTHKHLKHPNMKSPGDVSCGFCPLSVGKGQLDQHMKFKHPEEHNGMNRKVDSFDDQAVEKRETAEDLVNETSCKFCPKTFTGDRYLNLHLKYKHSKTFSTKTNIEIDGEEPASGQHFEESSMFEKEYQYKNIDQIKADDNTSIALETYSTKEHIKKDEDKNVQQIGIIKSIKKENKYDETPETFGKKKEIVSVSDSSSLSTKTLGSNEELNDQISGMMLKLGGKWTCMVCGKTGRDKSNVATHVEANHIKGKSHSCDMCGKVSRTRAALAVHVSLFHKNKC